MTTKTKAGAAQNSRLELVSFNYKLTENKLYVSRDYRRLDDGRLFKGSVAIHGILSRDEDAVKNFFEDAEVLMEFKEPSERNLVLYGDDGAITKLIEKGIISQQLNKKKKVEKKEA